MLLGESQIPWVIVFYSHRVLSDGVKFHFASDNNGGGS